LAATPPRPAPADGATRGVLPRRLAAWCLDAAILGAIVWWLAGAGLALPVLLLLPLAYGTLTIASPLSGTPGQVLCGLALRSEEDLGQPTPSQAFTATLLYLLCWASGGLAFLAALLSTRGRTAHDLFSGTVLLRAASPRQEAAAAPAWPMGSLADG
jgi:uncharacterized RDD family membrane protein YckC